VQLAAQARLVGGPVHRGGERGEVHRLLEEVHRALAHRAHRRGDVRVAGEENHPNLGVVGPDRFEEAEPVGVGQPEVDERDVGGVRGRRLTTGGGRGGRAHLVAEPLEEVGQRLAERVVVVDDEDREAHAAGSTMTTEVPVSGVLSRAMVPRCSSTMRWQRASPIPVPPGLEE
jgi:hypothetical protein